MIISDSPGLISVTGKVSAETQLELEIRFGLCESQRYVRTRNILGLSPSGDLERIDALNFVSSVGHSVGIFHLDDAIRAALSGRFDICAGLAAVDCKEKKNREEGLVIRINQLRLRLDIQIRT